MPLILITGLPCSGKTHRAHQLAAEFSTRISTDPSLSHLRVQHLQSRHASADPVVAFQSTTTDVQPSLRDRLYNSAKEEKTARAEEFSAIKRALSKDVVVVADGLNYIKGYRYQLWCEAKAAATRCCVVHVAAREDQCTAWNNERLRAAGREEEVEVEETEPHNEPVRGKNRLGEMVPESHTAIYGDRIMAPNSRSRSSSMGAESSDDEGPQAEDTMTLKSLYLKDRSGGAQYEEKEDKTNTNMLPTPSSNPTAETTPHASAEPPTPSSAYAYSVSTLTSLCMRYEPPSPFSRWDTPLFTVPTADVHPPYSAIWDSLFSSLHNTRKSKKALSQQLPSRTIPPAGAVADTSPDVKQHAATVLPKATDASALQTLEAATQRVATALLAAYRSSSDALGEGGEMQLSFHVGELTCEISVPPEVRLSQPMLQRLRRKYTGLQRGGIAHGVGGVENGSEAAVEGFVRFLAREWGEE